MITEYPLEDRRYDGSEYEPFWAAAEALDLPLSLYTATRRQGRIRRVGEKTLREASSRASKAFYPALSMCGSNSDGGMVPRSSPKDASPTQAAKPKAERLVEFNAIIDCRLAAACHRRGPPYRPRISDCIWPICGSLQLT